MGELHQHLLIMATITDTDTVLYNTSTKETIKVQDLIDQIKGTSLVTKYDGQTLDVLQPADADWTEGQTVTVNITFDFNP